MLVFCVTISSACVLTSIKPTARHAIAGVSGASRLDTYYAPKKSQPERAANRLTGNKSRPLMLRLRPCGWPHIGKSARSESTLRLPPCYFSPRPASRFASGAFVVSTLSCRQELPNHLSCHDILGEPFIVLGYACSRSNSRRQKTTKARIIYEGII